MDQKVYESVGCQASRGGEGRGGSCTCVAYHGLVELGGLREREREKERVRKRERERKRERVNDEE